MFFHKKKPSHKKAVFFAGILLVVGSILAIGILQKQDISNAQASVMRTASTRETTSGNCTKPFYDIPCSSPYMAAATWAKDKGILTGYADGSMQGDKAVNRAEALKLIFKTLGKENTTLGTKKPFSDVDLSSWYAPYVILAKELGIISGDKNGRFRGESEVVQAEFNKISLIAFNFVSSTPASTPWYEVFMTFAEKEKLFPFENATKNPEKVVSRFEAIESLYRMSKYIPKNPLPARTTLTSQGGKK